MSEIESPKEAIWRRIREARERSSAYEEEVREQDELRELEIKARLEENRARDLPHIEAAKVEHGEVRVVKTPLGAIVLKRPHHLSFQKFTRRVADKGVKDDYVWKLVKPCIVYPDITRVEDIVEEYPGANARMGSAVVELGNGEVEEFEGK